MDETEKGGDKNTVYDSNNEKKNYIQLWIKQKKFHFVNEWQNNVIAEKERDREKERQNVWFSR